MKLSLGRSRWSCNNNNNTISKDISRSLSIIMVNIRSNLINNLSSRDTNNTPSSSNNNNNKFLWFTKVPPRRLHTFRFNINNSIIPKDSRIINPNSIKLRRRSRNNNNNNNNSQFVPAF